jgi:hypothetical protein
LSLKAKNLTLHWGFVARKSKNNNGGFSRLIFDCMRCGMYRQLKFPNFLYSIRYKKYLEIETRGATFLAEKHQVGNFAICTTSIKLVFYITKTYESPSTGGGKSTKNNNWFCCALILIQDQAGHFIYCILYRVNEDQLVHHNYSME